MNYQTRYRINAADFGSFNKVIISLLTVSFLFFSASITWAGLDYSDYGHVLEKYVGNDGKVNYKGIKADPEKLDAAIKAMAGADPSGWSKNDQVAFYINAYNALTLKEVADNYPVPSIKDIGNVWDNRKFTVAGKKVSLNDIEHKILRVKYNEPRIHFGLVCASVGCPKLLNKPFKGSTLEAQLDARTRDFLSIPTSFRIADGTIHLSKIFKWFGKDFVSGFTPDSGFAGYGKNERAVLNFVSRYQKDDVADILKNKQLKISWSEYDWSLNE